MPPLRDSNNVQHGGLRGAFLVGKWFGIQETCVLVLILTLVKTHPLWVSSLMKRDGWVQPPSSHPRLCPGEGQPCITIAHARGVYAKRHT